MTTLPHPPAPVTTHYANHRFRSRLEARWAVWFDTLGIPWQYELEGYELDNGWWYLPDFYIPQWDTFIEVKPKEIENPDRAKCAILSDLLQKKVLALQGCPNLGEYFVTAFKPHPSSCEYPSCQFAYDRRDEGVVWLMHPDSMCGCVLDRPLTIHERYPLPDHPALDRAYRAASSARFERGGK